MKTEKRTALNLVVEVASFLVILGMIATGLVMHYGLPVATADSTHQGWSVWGWGLHGWGTAHFYLAMAAVTLLLVHFAMHWNWVCTALHRRVHSQDRVDAKPDLVMRHGYGIALVLLMFISMALFTTFALKSVDTSGRGERDLPAGFVKHASVSAPSH